MTSKNSIILNKYNIRAKKSWGQNFLMNDCTLLKIADSLEIENGDLVLEIGSGPGFLTSILLDKGAEVYAVEKEKTLVEVLNDRFKNIPSAHIIETNALRLNISDYLNNKSQKIKIIGNLPYHISTGIISNLMLQLDSIERLCFLVQKEVAERICCKQGTRKSGVLTYAVQIYCHSELAFTVGPDVFIPKPKVYSSLIALTPRDNRIIPDDYLDKTMYVIKTSFSQRRKTIKNCLKPLLAKKEDISLLDNIFDKIKLLPSLRPENMLLSDFYNLTIELDNLNLIKS